MKINLVSDLHLNWDGLKMPGGDILIMAGDVFDAVYFGISYKIGSPASLRVKDTYKRFIEEELTKYSKVLYVLGNHEHYHHIYCDTFDVLRNNMPNNVVIMENDTILIDDTLFFGATFWTDFAKGNPVYMQAAQYAMNDFKVIKNEDTKLTPEFVRKVHQVSKQHLKDIVVKATSVGKNLVVITHHAPSFASVPEAYDNDILNYAYASAQEEFILDNPIIKVWVHGHMHHFNDYRIGSTRVVSNPRGYAGHERSSNNFDPGFYFDV